MTKHSIAKIHALGLGLMLALGACDKGENKDAKATADAKAAGNEADAKAAGDKADAKAADADADADAPLDPKVVKAAGLAKKIEAEPARADEILAEAGMDRDAFESLIYEVSTPELAEQYRLARAREEG